MLVMASEKKSAGRGRGRPATGRKPIYNIHVNIEIEVGMAFEKWMMAQEFEVKQKDVFEKMLKQFLSERGFWPGTDGSK